MHMNRIYTILPLVDRIVPLFIGKKNPEDIQLLLYRPTGYSSCTKKNMKTEKVQINKNVQIVLKKAEIGNYYYSNKQQYLNYRK